MNLVKTENETSVTINGVLPSEAEWHEILSQDYIVNVLAMPHQEGDLSGLSSHLDVISRLAVSSYSCSDLRLIDQMPNLRWLAIGGRVTQSPLLTPLTKLQYFGGPLRRFERVTSLPSLTTTKLLLAGQDDLSIGAGVIDVTLGNAKNITSLDFAREPTSIQRLHVEGSKRLDLAAATRMTALKSLYLENIGTIDAAEVLVSLPALEDLVLESCERITNFQDLSSLSSAVTVIGRNPFPASFRARVDPAKWTFPPSLRYLPEG